jgi:D-alanyl-D-alanine carboxypeptidase
VSALTKAQVIIAIMLAASGMAALPLKAGPSLLFEPATGKVISQDRAGMPWYPASLTKLMTAYLTFQRLREGRLKLDQEITVSSVAARQPPSKIGISAGGKVTVDFALQALLVYSANDIAVVLGEAVSGNLPSFVVEMNKAAKRIGMTGSRFLNPSGLHDANHFSTARDIALLAATVYEEFPEYRHYYDQDFMAVGKRKLRNRNRLLFQMPQADGMKTGFVCAAGFNLVATAQIDGKRLMAVLLGASNGSNRADWAQSLLLAGAERAARNMMVKDIINGSASITEPPNLTPEVCERRRGLALKPATALKGYGVSLGQFERRDEALKVLRIWSDSGDAYMEGASKGLIRLPNTKGFAAVVWDLDAREAQSLCSFLKDRNATCGLMQPEELQKLAEQARSEAKSKAKPKKRSKRKKKG